MAYEAGRKEAAQPLWFALSWVRLSFSLHPGGRYLRAGPCVRVSIRQFFSPDQSRRTRLSLGPDERAESDWKGGERRARTAYLRNFEAIASRLRELQNGVAISRH